MKYNITCKRKALPEIHVNSLIIAVHKRLHEIQNVQKENLRFRCICIHCLQVAVYVFLVCDRKVSIIGWPSLTEKKIKYVKLT